MPAAGRKFLIFLTFKGPLSLSLSSQKYKCLPQAELFLAFMALKGHLLLVYNNISACRRQNFFVLFGFERAPSASLSSHQYKCLPQAKEFFLADQIHFMQNFPIRFFLFSWGGVGQILGGGVHFPSRGRVALRASRGGIPAFPPYWLTV